MIILRKAPLLLFELWADLAVFTMKYHFLCRKEQLSKWLYRFGYLADIFTKNEQSKSVSSRKTTDSICCQSKWWNLSFQAKNQNFGKPVFAYSFSILTAFSEETGGGINKF